MRTFRQSSRSVSNLFFLIGSTEPSKAEAAKASGSCIYLGRSYIRSMPSFLDLSASINPHIFIFGMTGSGKSYLMKSLIMMLSVISDALVLVIDITGEYAEFGDFAVNVESTAQLPEASS